MIHYLWMFIVGIVVGAIARLIVPGQEHMGLILTGVLGIVGSFIGGFIGSLISKPAEGSMFHPAGFINARACCRSRTSLMAAFVAMARRM